MSDLVDDMLLGDFDYIVDGDEVYADVDYDRLTHECGGRVRPPAPPATLVTRDRRPGMVAAQPAVCTSPVLPLTAAAARTPSAR
jgi:hypothetical protein